MITMDFEGSQLHEDWARHVKRGQPNDFVVVVTASSKTPVSGTGKTTLLTNLAEATDETSEGFNAETKASLDAGEIAYNVVPEVEPKSALVWDEAQGAPGTVGLDARRAMKQEAIDSMSSILANRDKQFTILIGAQVFSMLDPRIYPMVDAWLLIRKGVDATNGPVGTYYKVVVEDFNLSNPSLKTPAVEDFSWPKVPETNENYAELERLKQEAKTKSDDDSNPDPEKVEAKMKKRYAQRLRDRGVAQTKIADIIEMSQSWISQNTTPPDGKPDIEA